MTYFVIPLGSHLVLATKILRVDALRNQPLLFLYQGNFQAGLLPV
jgi:hypothetical protein